MFAGMPPKVSHLFGLIFAVKLGLVGCQSLQQVNWDGRIGRFNFEQAVAELGQPDSQKNIAGGMLRVEWIMNSGLSTGRSSVGAGYQSRTTNLVPLEPAEIHRLRDRYLRLTFDKAGQLVAWENGTKSGN